MRRPSGAEFIALVALTTSLVAMSIDTMLPALGEMATELGAHGSNDRQLILTSLFGGLTVGQLIYGPVSDSTGRKPALYAGMLLFMLGGLLCAVTSSFQLLLFGRALQGFGAAGPRIVAVALVRDLYTGRAMARVMSFVSSVFIVVPILAPSVGQAVLMVASWRVIFVGLVVIGAFNWIWFAWRQRETLPLAGRAPFSLPTIARAAAATLKTPITLGYMLASGLVFGAFINYLTTSQQIFQEQYRLGKLFPLAFATLAFSLGLASFANGKLVMRLGMRTLSRWALCIQCSLSCGLFPIAWLCGGHLPLLVLMGYLIVCFFCNGLLFGNFNARAMEPMGQIAGVAAAVTGSVSNLIAVALGGAFGRAYDGTVLPLIAGFAAMGAGALAVTEWAERSPGVTAGHPPSILSMDRSGVVDALGVGESRSARSVGVSAGQTTDESDQQNRTECK